MMARREKDHHTRAQLGPARKPPAATYQARISNYGTAEWAGGDAALSAYGELYGRVERKLFAEGAAGRPATALKSAYMKRYGIPARMFNAVRVSLEGKVESVREQQKLRADSLTRRIARAELQIARAERHGRLDQAPSEAAEIGQPAASPGGAGSRLGSRPCEVVLWVKAIVAEATPP